MVYSHGDVLMKYSVAYFSRTGNSGRIAQKIAQKLSTDAIEVTDNMNWKGPIGYMRAGRCALNNKDVDISIHGKIDSDEFIVVTPLWAGKITPAIRKLLQTLPKDKVHLIVSSGSSTLKERADYKSVLDIIKKEKNEDEKIAAFTGSLSQ